MRVLIVLAVFITALTFGNNGSLAQQTLAPNRVVEELLRASPNELTIELSGYVGPSDPGTVRLYKDLSLSSYFDIPKDAIVSQEGDSKTGPVKLHVRNSATIVLGGRLKADAAGALNSITQRSQGGRLRADTAGAMNSAMPISNSLTCALLLIACGEGNVGACYLYVMYCPVTLPYR
jgi:hypothetical protein